jgi:hypothetical protein
MTIRQELALLELIALVRELVKHDAAGERLTKALALLARLDA